MSFIVEYGEDAWLRWDNDREEFEIVKALPVIWNVNGKVIVRFEVKEGFYSDLASIPRLATAVIPKLGHHVRAAIVHDWTYRKLHHEGISRAQADLLFLHGMETDGVRGFRRRILYRSVRLGGDSSWRSKKKEIEEDEDSETFADS